MNLTLTVSCGLADSSGAESPDELLRQARDAASAALERGGNRIVTREQELIDEQWQSAMESGSLYDATLARHLMTPFVWSLHNSESLSCSAPLLERTALPCLPVVDGEGCFRGLLTRGPSGEDLSRTAGEACLADVPQADADTPLAEVVEMIIDRCTSRWW